MVSLPSEEQLPFDSLDRLVRVKMRPKGMSAYSQISDFVYDVARGNNPISMDIAEALAPDTPRKIGIFTGASSPDHYPNGENDGPLGAVVLANALAELGHDTHLFLDPQVGPIVHALMEYYGRAHGVVVLDVDSLATNLRAAEGLEVAIAVEKAGLNPAGLLHALTGTSREGTRAKVDDIFRAVQANGGITISCADGHNEIGFGKVYDQVAERAPWTTTCVCGCGQGVMCVTPVDHLYVTSVSNWGAYALVGALALRNRMPSLLHTEEAERDIEQLAVDYDVRDGMYGKAALSMDGIPLTASLAMLAMMRDLVNISLASYVRDY